MYNMKISNNYYSLANAFLPIIIICFFLLDSMIYKNVRGIIFIIGICFCIMSTILVGNTFNFSKLDNLSEICTPFSMNNMSRYSNIPLSTSMIVFTAVSLIFTIIKYNLITTNIPFILIMALLIITDSLWLAQNNCYTNYQILFSCLTGAIIAVLWSHILHKSNNKQFIYTLGIDNNNICEIPKKKAFKCQYKTTQNANSP